MKCRFLPLLFIMCVFFLSACGKNSLSSWGPTTPDTKNYSFLATKEDISSALGVTVGDPSAVGSSGVEFLADKGDSKVDIFVNENARSDFDNFIKNTYDPNGLTETPNLGDIAYWSSGTGELLVYAKGYQFSVVVVKSGADEDKLQTISRAVATIAIGNLN